MRSSERGQYLERVHTLISVHICCLSITKLKHRKMERHLAWAAHFNRLAPTTVYQLLRSAIGIALRPIHRLFGQHPVQFRLVWIEAVVLKDSASGYNDDAGGCREYQTSKSLSWRQHVFSIYLSCMRPCLRPPMSGQEADTRVVLCDPMGCVLHRGRRIKDWHGYMPSSFMWVNGGSLLVW